MISTSNKPRHQKKSPPDNELILPRSKISKFKSKDAVTPMLNAALKAHKPEKDFPLREICNPINSPGHDLAKALFQLHKGYVGNTKTFLKNGSEFVEIMKTNRFNKGGVHVSFDADLLYPSLIVEKGLQILNEKSIADKELHQRTDLSKEEIMRLTYLCTSSSFFQCEHGIFSQTKGEPIGGPLSGLLGDLVLENKIEKVVSTHPKWGKMWDWVRKADDTFMEWCSSLEDLEEFHSYLNNLHPTIKWSKEIQKEDRLNFLDVLVIRKDQFIETTVYKKPSASN